MTDELGNTGHENTGNFNSGFGNTGNWNSGDRNTGDFNSGNFNSGDWNSGHFNSGDWNSGHFNTTTPDTIRCFNREVSRREWERARKPTWLFMPRLANFIHTDEMSAAEKEAHPEHKTSGGYLRKNDMREEWRKAYESASPEDVQAVRDLPGFDAKVFEEITGLDLGEAE